MKKTLTLITGFAALLFSAHVAFADQLDDAKKAGLVGERQDGYLGVVTASPSGDVKALVKDINAKRKAEYQRIATSAGQPLNVVEKLAAAKAIENTWPGNYVMDAAGNWVKK